MSKITVSLTLDQVSLIRNALQYWANYIETGDMTLCSEDASRMGSNINPLNLDQMKHIIALRELAQEIGTK